jgi:hypothetical protein
MTAQVWNVPASTDEAVPLKPVTTTGVMDFVVLPLPSWPSVLLPQHCTEPVLVNAQVWLLPVLTIGVGGGV